MKKLVAGTAAALLVFAPTAAAAETRPGATEFTQPVEGASELGDDNDDGGSEWELILLGVAALIGIILAASSSKGNSPR